MVTSQEPLKFKSDNDNELLTLPESQSPALHPTKRPLTEPPPPESTPWYPPPSWSPVNILGTNISHKADSLEGFKWWDAADAAWLETTSQRKDTQAGTAAGGYPWKKLRLLFAQISQQQIVQVYVLTRNCIKLYRGIKNNDKLNQQATPNKSQ